MSFTDILNREMDLNSLIALGRQGVAWWLDELSRLLPDSWRLRLSSRSAAWIEPSDAHGWRLRVGGSLIEAAAPDPKARGRLGLLAPRGSVLIREVPVPRMPAADVRRMIALDIDRLSPLAPELVYFDQEIIDRGDDGGHQTVLLGIIPRAEADAMVWGAWEAGYRPVTFAAPIGSDGSPRFDFLPAVRAASGRRTGDAIRRYAWTAAVALIFVNLAVLVGRDMVGVDRLRHAVEAQQPGVDAVQRLRRRVMAEDGRRRDLLARGRRNDPLRLLSILSGALPGGDSIQRLDWNGTTLRIVGYERADSDIALALRNSGAFLDGKLLTGAPTATGFRPFDLTATARTTARR